MTVSLYSFEGPGTLGFDLMNGKESAGACRFLEFVRPTKLAIAISEPITHTEAQAANCSEPVDAGKGFT